MKSIGIITIHTTYNYGAILQAYATEQFYNCHGYNAELVNYTNDHIQEQLRLSYKQDGKYKGYLITLIRNTAFKRLYYYKKMYKSIERNCKLSADKYHNPVELSGMIYDVLIAGSDQVWNPIITGGLDPAFFLRYGKAKKRISLASSMGSYTLTEKEKEYIKNCLLDFDAISVREEFAKKQLQTLVDQEIKVLMDPTFLLNKEEWWDNLGIKSKYANISEKYILTYFAGGNKSSHRKIIREYSQKLNLPVWTIQYSNYTWKESSKKILGASIEDFIALIKNTELLITDSFHGTALSLNLQSDFLPLTNKANPVRVKALLNKIGLADRIDMPVDRYTKVDYTRVTSLLEELRKDSIEWALNAIER